MALFRFEVNGSSLVIETDEIAAIVIPSKQIIPPATEIPQATIMFKLNPHQLEMPIEFAEVIAKTMQPVGVTRVNGNN